VAFADFHLSSTMDATHVQQFIPKARGISMVPTGTGVDPEVALGPPLEFRLNGVELGADRGRRVFLEGSVVIEPSADLDVQKGFLGLSIRSIRFELGTKVR